jgi:hypothetical protein
MIKNNIVKGFAVLALIAGIGVAGTACAPADAETNAPAAKSAPAKSGKPAKKAEKKEAPKTETVKVKASTLIKAFEKNELKADKTYKGKTLEVSGVVEKIDTDILDEDVYILSVAGGGDFEILTVNFRDVPEAQLDKLDTGDKVTVIGDFKDGGDLGVEIDHAHVK